MSASAGGSTATERRVASRPIDGLANKEIARVLVVTVNTVEFDLRSTYAKLGIRSRVQLAAALDGLREALWSALGSFWGRPGSFLGSGEPRSSGLRTFLKQRRPGTDRSRHG